MSTMLASSRNEVINGIGVSAQRRLNGREARAPAGATVVSADTHLGLNRDIFYERAPAHLRERMPRIWFDEALGIWNMGIGRKGFITKILADVIKSIEARPGVFTMPERMADLDAEGVAMELVFAQQLPLYFHLADFEAREWIFRIYNEYLAELGRQVPGRFFGAGIPNYWDPHKTRDSIQHIKEIGLKTYYMPVHPGNNVSGKPILYGNEEMDGLWDAADEAGLPVCFHIGESLSFSGRGAMARDILVNMGPFRKTLGELIFGGVLDRHPSLKIVFVEANLAWIPAALQDAEMIVDSYAQHVQPELQLRPSDYWARNFYATFMHDPIGLKLLDYIGADRVMWSTDYPHNESTMGYSADAINAVVDAVSESDARKMLGETAISVFNLRN